MLCWARQAPVLEGGGVHPNARRFQRWLSAYADMNGHLDADWYAHTLDALRILHGHSFDLRSLFDIAADRRLDHPVPESGAFRAAEEFYLHQPGGPRGASATQRAQELLLDRGGDGAPPGAGVAEGGLGARGARPGPHAHGLDLQPCRERGAGGVTTRAPAKRPRPAAPGERQARYRESGRQVAVVLRDPAAIVALEALVEAEGSQRAAIEYALRVALQQP